MTQREEFIQIVQKYWDIAKLYEDLKIAKEKYAPHKRQGLSELEKEYLLGLLCGYNPTELASKICKQPSTINSDLSRSLYRYVEVLTGREENSLRSWQDVVCWLEPKYKRIENWDSAPNISNFYGRDRELATLEQWIVKEQCRLVAIIGIGGIGKTSLSVKLAREIKDKFQIIIWRSLRYTPRLEEIVGDLVSVVTNHQEFESLETLEARIENLLKFLRLRRCLIVLDGLETLMCTNKLAGEYHECYQEYGDFCREIGNSEHQSCLLLTSSEKSAEIALLEGKNSPVRSLKLEGLQLKAAKNILQVRNLVEEPEWVNLIQRYQGNPTYLKIVSTTIAEVFQGRTSEFFSKNSTYLGHISEILDQQFERLSDLEIRIIYKLATAQKTLNHPELQKRICLQVSTTKITDALQSLIRRCLIETSSVSSREKETVYTIQPLIRKYVINRFSNL
ncbi:NB-ARC domain-containing protein [Oscillatoria salina]|uniref:NB-ARC domain-containing protein n=1 Tax=Oscillatoria salina TaxID=331517 RepID=UPI0013BC6109|nr:NB-ARC domain-containing protein [Oscillatoria salina]MBZ8179748.1 hypothetical protein [Oscillatoria salina IIICB1]NET87149.1 hypothetical protein [Kamptonema sp. SIO1D9]